MFNHKEYAKVYNKKYYREHWKRKREDYLKDKSCVVCGSTERLEIDHINPEEKDHRASRKIFFNSKERQEKELVKCQVLCYNCHKAKTKEDIRKLNSKKSIRHGLNSYVKKKCNCNICQTAYDNYKEKQNYNSRQKHIKYRKENPKKIVTHGDVSMYTNKKCRCKLCIQANRDYKRVRYIPKDKRDL